MTQETPNPQAEILRCKCGAIRAVIMLPIHPDSIIQWEREKAPIIWLGGALETILIEPGRLADFGSHKDNCSLNQ